MSIQDIEKALVKKSGTSSLVRINFRSRRAPVAGMFIECRDSAELKKKNLWRIVSEGNVEGYNETHNGDLARIFNGIDFSSLESLDNRSL